MSDAAQQGGDWAEAGRPFEEPGGAGALLRQAREGAGLHIEVLASTLKVPVSKLAALEGDRLHELPDAVFARALAASVCRTLGVEPGAVLDRMPKNPSPRLAQDDESINAPFRGSREIYRASPWSQISKPVVLAVLALLLAALVLIFLPSMRHDTASAGAAPQATGATDEARAAPKDAPASPAEARPGVAAAVATGTPAPATQAPAANHVVETVPAAATTPAPAAPPTATTAVATATGSATGSPAPSGADAATAAAPTIVVTAHAASWVEVKDAQGKILVRETLAPAQVAQASGALPMSVVIGRADAVAVRVKGEPFDLKPATRGSIARFEVK